MDSISRDEEPLPSHPPSCSNLGPLNSILPKSPLELLNHIPTLSVLGSAYTSSLTLAAEQLYSRDYWPCIETCNILLDQTWEKLNTGYWKDVDINWRYSYTLVSMIKALSQCALLNDSDSNIDHAAILKTCDMGLLMGAPIIDNILAKMSRKFQESFGNRRPSVTLEEHAVGEIEKPEYDKIPKKIFKQDCNSGTEENRLVQNASLSLALNKKEKEVPNCCCPSVEMFQATFFDLQHPVLISGAIGYWPAFTTHKWTISYLQKIAGARTVPVEIGSKYTEEDWTQKIMTVNEFISTFILNPSPPAKGYLAQHNLFDQVNIAILRGFYIN